MKLKSLIFALFLANPLAWSKCPEVWVGSYAWEETWGGHPSGEEITNGHYYSLNIFDNDGKCEAELDGDGNQLEMRILADVQGDDKEISLIYREKATEAGIGSEGNKGDVLFKLKWKEPESDNAEIITSWGTFTPELDENKKAGNYFYLTDNSVVEVEVGKATEKGTPLTFTALTDLTLEFRDGTEADLDNMAWWEKKPKISKPLKEGEKYTFDFLPAGDIPNLAICADVEVENHCSFPSLSGKDGSVEGFGTGFTLKEE